MKSLLEEALKARERAYVPYSTFKVGAALETIEGIIFTGCNIENASYGLTICAERVAFYRAIARGYKQFKTILTVTESHEPTSPCGACRQVMYEFAPHLQVIMMTTTGEKIEKSLQELLPGAFSKDSLGEERDHG